VLGGRYGLGSKEFFPRAVKAALDGLDDPATPRSFTLGIIDDVTHLSLPLDESFTTERPEVNRALFYGMGSDGTVGANKNSVKIIGENTDLDAQGYFVYDSKKSGAVTVSHLRFGPAPVTSPYLIEQAGFIGIHRFDLVYERDVLGLAAPGATVLFNAPHAPAELWDHLPVECQRHRARARPQALDDRRRQGRPRRRHGRAHQHDHADLLLRALGRAAARRGDPRDQDAIDKTYGKRGGTVLARNHAAVDAALEHLHEAPVPAEGEGTLRLRDAVPQAAPDFMQRVTARIMEGYGDLLPVSALPVDGTYPTDTAAGRSARSPTRSRSGRATSAPSAPLRAGLPARGHPRQRGARVRARGRARRLQVGRLARQGRVAAGLPVHRPARPRRLHRLRRLRRRLPGARQARAQAQGDQHDAQAARARAGARLVGLLRDAAATRAPTSTRSTRSRRRSCATPTSSSPAPAPAAARPATSSC
jgi:Pyruvate/2-oxoacid:ferredoxin oxidoreductase gamma subunit